MNRWILPLTAASLVLNAGLACGLVSMATSSEAVPVAIVVDTDAGSIGSARVSAQEFQRQVEANQVLLTSQVRSFVSDLLTLDPYLTNANLKRVKARLTGTASADFRDYMASETPPERLVKTDGLTRTVDPIKVDVSQRGLAFVSAQTNERVGASSPVVKTWRMTIRYTVEPQDDAASIVDNPLGFKVSHFTRALEAEK